MSKLLFFILLAIVILVGLRRLPALKTGVRGFLREYRAGREGRSDIEITARPVRDVRDERDR